MKRGFLFFGILIVLCVSVFTVQAATTQYRLQIASVATESDAQQLSSTLRGKTSLAMEILPFQGKYYVLAGTFQTQDEAAEAAKAPALKEFANLDVVRVVFEQMSLQAGDTIYQVQLGNFSTSANAETARDDAMSRGLKPITIAESGGYHKVRYGQFPTREAAVASLDQVHNAGYSDAWITTSKIAQGKSGTQVLSVEPLNLMQAPAIAQVQPGPAETVSRTAPIQLASEQPRQLTQPIAAVPAQSIWQNSNQPSYSNAAPAPVVVPDVVVSTQPVTEAKKKAPVPIQVKAEGADQVVLYYRLKGGHSFIKVPMVRGSEGFWQAEIPSWAVTSLGVEYYIQAKKSFRRYTGDADEENPYLIQVK